MKQEFRGMRCLTCLQPGRIVQSVGHLTRKSPGFDTGSGNILSFPLPLFQEGQLSVTGESMCTKVLVNRLGGLSLPTKSVVRFTDHPEMTLDVYRGRKTIMQQQQNHMPAFCHKIESNL